MRLVMNQKIHTQVLNYNMAIGSARLKYVGIGHVYQTMGQLKRVPEYCKKCERAIRKGSEIRFINGRVFYHKKCV